MPVHCLADAFCTPYIYDMSSPLLGPPAKSTKEGAFFTANSNDGGDTAPSGSQRHRICYLRNSDGR